MKRLLTGWSHAHCAGYDDSIIIMKIIPRGRSRLSTMASRTSSKLDTLREICEMEEMKRETSVTKSILIATTCRYILSTQNEEFTCFIDKVNGIFKGMLKSVDRCKSITTKRVKSLD